MNDTLFIIGNGFDLHHGMMTSYGHFREFIKRKPVIWRRLQTLYGNEVEKDMWWYKYEEMLSKVNYQHLMHSENGMALSPTWVDNFLTNNLPVFFGEWLSQIDEHREPDLSLGLDSTAQYFTFNYTMTLERVYGIDARNVWHIHNSLEDIQREGKHPIVGHDSDERQLFLQLVEQSKTDSNVGYCEIVGQINQKIASGAKKVKGRIDENENIFHERYSHIRHYVSMGFSYNDIDMPYIAKIVEVNQDISEAEWLFYIHSEQEKVRLQEIIHKYEINNNNMHFLRW